jgi:hypothetical protein
LLGLLLRRVEPRLLGLALHAHLLCGLHSGLLLGEFGLLVGKLLLLLLRAELGLLCIDPLLLRELLLLPLFLHAELGLLHRCLLRVEALLLLSLQERLLLLPLASCRAAIAVEPVGQPAGKARLGLGRWRRGIDHRLRRWGAEADLLPARELLRFHGAALAFGGPMRLLLRLVRIVVGAPFGLLGHVLRPLRARGGDFGAALRPVGGDHPAMLAFARKIIEIGGAIVIARGIVHPLAIVVRRQQLPGCRRPPRVAGRNRHSCIADRARGRACPTRPGSNNSDSRRRSARHSAGHRRWSATPTG